MQLLLCFQVNVKIIESKYERVGSENKMKITTTAFSCKRDGLTIRGTEYRPQGDKLPIAIVSHGFMANQGTVKHYAKYLAELGYAAYCFDFNGGCVVFGKSEGKTTEMSVLTEKQDLQAVLAYACNLPYTDETNVILMGCSQGGFVSALTAAELKEKVKKLILFYPAFCIPDDARKGRMMWAKFDPENIPEIISCGPMKLGRCYVETVLNMNPYEEIAGYENDVLLVHGTADKIVDIKYAEDAVATYAKNEKRVVEYHKIEGGAHMFSKKHDREAMKWLKEFVG